MLIQQLKAAHVDFPGSSKSTLLSHSSHCAACELPIRCQSRSTLTDVKSSPPPRSQKLNVEPLVLVWLLTVKQVVCNRICCFQSHMQCAQTTSAGRPQGPSLCSSLKYSFSLYPLAYSEVSLLPEAAGYTMLTTNRFPMDVVIYHFTILPTF